MVLLKFGVYVGFYKLLLWMIFSLWWLWCNSVIKRFLVKLGNVKIKVIILVKDKGINENWK